MNPPENPTSLRIPCPKRWALWGAAEQAAYREEHRASARADALAARIDEAAPAVRMLVSSYGDERVAGQLALQRRLVAMLTRFLPQFAELIDWVADYTVTYATEGELAVPLEED